jgi:hypothetical protein
MRLDPSSPDPDRNPVGIQWRQLGQWALFVAAFAFIVAILAGIGTQKSWLWSLF